MEAFEELSKRGMVFEASWETGLKSLVDVKPSDAVKAL